jgi:hypothetical protein
MSEEIQTSESEKKKEDWMNSKWRPMMGWMYMFVCVFDFVLAPIGWTSIQALFHGGINTQWQPLTLQGGGLFHVAMGAVIGISAYGRTKEKLEGVAGSNQPMGTQYVPPGGMQGGMGMGGMNSGMGGGFNNGGGFGGSTMGGASTFSAPPAGGFGGASGFSSPTPATTGFGSAPLGGNSASSFGGSGFGSAPTAPATGGFPSAPSASPSGFPSAPPAFGGSKIAPPAFPPI